ncbi:DUF4139 domain-containing protein [bacterium]|nr:MAG: DUF4139 domain-containing protein [bacterium]
MKHVVMLFLLLYATGAAAQINDPSIKITKMDVFKNGSSFVVCEGKISLSQGVGTIRGIPDAAFGTLWVAPIEKGIQIDELKAVREKRAVKRNAESLLDMLKANTGKKVVWQHRSEKVLSTTAILENVTGTDERILVTLKNANQTITAQVSAYYDFFEFPEGFNNQIDDTTQTTSLQIKTNSTMSEATFQMVYFQSGIGWTPSYRIELMDDKTAQLLLSASLINDSQNLTNTRLNLVVGFPHFIYSDIESPLTMRQTLSQFLQSLSGADNPYTQRYASPLANQSVMYERSINMYAETDFGNFKSLEGVAEEDLFFYDLAKVTLRKGERGQYNIFSASVPYAHIFEVNLPNALSSDGYAVEKKEPYQVWHSVKLENRSSQPWTTGSAITFQNGKPLGQDILRYTAVKSFTTVKITQSPDLRVTEEEKETTRKEEVRKKDGYYYDLVTITGEIVINNYKNKDARIIVTRPITGKIITAEYQPKITQPAMMRNALNLENNLEWDVSVKAGDEKKITYTYEIFLRR